MRYDDFLHNASINKKLSEILCDCPDMSSPTLSPEIPEQRQESPVVVHSPPISPVIPSSSLWDKTINNVSLALSVNMSGHGNVSS